MSDDRKLTQDDLRRIVEDGISEDVKALEGGRQDMEAATSLLEEFRLSNPQDVPPRLFDWLHEVFGRILKGEAAEEALGMKRRRGERKKSGRVDPIAIAMFVELDTRQGANLERAMENACEYFKRELDTIRAALKYVTVEPRLSEETMRDYIREHRRPE